MRQNVYFDNISSEDLGIIFLGGTIGTPTAKKLNVEIPYSDGVIDLTDYYGVVRYNNRTISLNFIVDPDEDRETVIREVLELNGKRVRLTVPNCPDEYFIGRLSVSDPEVTNSKKLLLTVTCDAEPYCYEDIDIIRSLSAAADIICPNGKMPTSPTIVTDAAITVGFGSASVTLAAGTHKVTAFRFTEGNNTLTITPATSANVKILYTSGRL